MPTVKLTRTVLLPRPGASNANDEHYEGEEVEVPAPVAERLERIGAAEPVAKRGRAKKADEEE